jgi:hypothetical protein
MNATLRPAGAIGVAVVLAAAVFAVVTAAATNSARAAPGATDRAEAAPKVLIFGQGTWNGSGRRHETFTDGPYPLDVDTRISFTLKVAANGRASGSFRQEGTSTPNGNGWGGQMKHVITGTLAGDAGNVAIVGQISTAGTITYKGKGVPLASTKAYSARLGPTSAGCNVVNSKYWTARRVAGTGKTPAPATIKTSEKNALQALDAALDMRPYNPPLDTLRSVTGWLYTLNLQIEAARTCGVAPAGYKRGLPGRVDVVTVLRDLIKSLASQGKPYSAFGYQPNDVVNLVNSAVDAGLMGDPTVRQALESWLDQALTDRFGKAGAEGVVDDIERAARRAGMSSLADRAAKG